MAFPVRGTHTRIVAGLGNPGRKYEWTRHNLGFRVVDEVARRFDVSRWRNKDGAQQAHVAAQSVVLLKPQSYMNESGRPIGRIAGWWKASPHDVLIVVDDLDLPFGRLRMRESGGSGGHNGLKSIIEYLGEDFPRLRIGIGRGGEDDAIDRVLSTFTPDEERRLAPILDVAAKGVLLWLERGAIDAINYVNAWRPEEGTSAASDQVPNL
jgi:PTH1 family peptidyl-tRNA hydrolase